MSEGQVQSGQEDGGVCSFPYHSSCLQSNTNCKYTSIATDVLIIIVFLKVLLHICIW